MPLGKKLSCSGKRIYPIDLHDNVLTKAGTTNRIIDQLIDKFQKKIIVTDLIIIIHLISVSLTLPYLPLVFRHLNCLPYLI